MYGDTKHDAHRASTPDDDFAVLSLYSCAEEQGSSRRTHRETEGAVGRAVLSVPFQEENLLFHDCVPLRFGEEACGYENPRVF